jgi:hypothetical protein
MVREHNVQTSTVVAIDAFEAFVRTLAVVVLIFFIWRVEIALRAMLQAVRRIARAQDGRISLSESRREEP